MEGRIGGNLEIEITGVLKNTGDRAGQEVIQLYAGLPESDQPVKQLKAFTKLSAEPGESVPFCLTLSEEDVMTFNVESNDFSAKKGTYKLYLGTSVQDIVFETTFMIG